MSSESENKRIDFTQLEALQLASIDPFKPGLGRQDVSNLIAELKRCYYEIDLLREYAKCGNCGGRYIGPMDYGLHEWEHSEDCFDASE